MKLFELFGKGQNVVEDTMQWNVGDKVHPKWESGGSWEPMVVVDVHGLQITVKDDHGKEHLLAPNDIVSAEMAEGGAPGQIRSTKIKHGHKYRPHKHKNKKALGKWQGDDKREEELEEGDPRMPAVRDRNRNTPFGEIGKRPSLKRQGQRAGRNLNRNYGIGNPSKNAAQAFDIDEAADEAAEDGKITSRDPRITAMIKKARVQYSGTAADDLSALVSMMNAEQEVQDKELDHLDDYNLGQDNDITHTDHVNVDQEIEIGDLAARIDQLEKEQGVSQAMPPRSLPPGDDITNEANPKRPAVLDRSHNYPTGEHGAKPSSKRQNQWIDRNLRGQYGKGGKPAHAEKLYDLGETIKPYGDGEYADDETGEIFKSDPRQAPKVAKGNAGRHYGKSVDHEAISMFGDIAAGGGDPIDHLMTMHGMDMEEIDELAREQGFADANEWAESYAEQYEMESIIGNSNKLNNR